MEHGIYKVVNGQVIRWFKDGDVYLLQQNPYTASIYATAVCFANCSIQWELSEMPIENKPLKYTGVIYINGFRYQSKEQARKVIEQHIVQKIEVA